MPDYMLPDLRGHDLEELTEAVEKLSRLREKKRDAEAEVRTLRDEHDRAGREDHHARVAAMATGGEDPGDRARERRLELENEIQQNSEHRAVLNEAIEMGHSAVAKALQTNGDRYRATVSGAFAEKAAEVREALDALAPRLADLAADQRLLKWLCGDANQHVRRNPEYLGGDVAALPGQVAGLAAVIAEAASAAQTLEPAGARELQAARERGEQLPVNPANPLSGA